MPRKCQMQKQTDTLRQGALGTRAPSSSLVGLQPGGLPHESQGERKWQEGSAAGDRSEQKPSSTPVGGLTTRMLGSVIGDVPTAPFEQVRPVIK